MSAYFVADFLFPYLLPVVSASWMADFARAFTTYGMRRVSFVMIVAVTLPKEEATYVSSLS